MVTAKFIYATSAFIGICIIIVNAVEAAPMPSYNSRYYNDVEETPEEILMELIARFGQTIMRARNDLENSKRTIDFGLARGYSGTQAAKYRMGLAAANSPNGPGRRRRSATDI